jgi:hypothetical protein
MGADMLIATIAAPADREAPIDFDRGRRVLERCSDVQAFEFNDPEQQLVELVEGFDAHVHLDADGEPTLEAVRAAGLRVVDRLAEALDSRETTTIGVAGYCLYLSGGLSGGDAPTDAAQAIWDARILPPDVLLAMGFVPDHRKALSRTNGSTGPVTDTDVVDTIALMLGTSPEWTGAQDLERIADIIGAVRPHPGNLGPFEYRREFADLRCFDPLDDGLLSEYVSAAAGDGA